MDKFGWTRDQVERKINAGQVLLIGHTDIPIELYEGARKDVMASIVESATEKVWKEYEGTLNPDQLKDIKDIKDRIKSSMEELYLAKGWGQHLIGRKGVKGYREDVHNVLAEYLNGFNAFQAKGRAAREFAKVMKDVDPTKVPVQWTHGKEFISDMLGETYEAGFFKRIAGTYFLAADLSAAALNMTQNWTHAVPMLRAIKPKTGKVAAEQEIFKAMKDVAAEFAATRGKDRKMFEKASKRINQEEIDALREAYEKGFLDPAFLGETTGLHPNKVWQSYTKRVQQGLYFMFTGAEGMNRTSTFLAAYRRSKRAGTEDPVRAAVDVVQAAHFLYGRGNRPAWVRKTGPIGNIAYTFMTYPVSNLVFLKHRAEDIFTAYHKGDTAAVKTSLNVLGSNLAYVFAFGGLIGLPFAWLAQPILDLFDDDEEDWEVLIRKHMPKTVGRAVARGIPAVLLGSDMSWRVQGTDALGIPIGFQIAEMGKRRAQKAHKLFGQGEYLDALFHLAPDMIRNPYRAYIGFKEGGERVGVPPIKYALGEAATKSLGFTPTREAETYKAISVTRKRRENRLEDLERFAERYLIARKRKDGAAIENLRAEVKKYNARLREKEQGDLAIKWSDVVSSSRKRRRSREKVYAEHTPRYMKHYQKEVSQTLGTY